MACLRKRGKENIFLKDVQKKAHRVFENRTKRRPAQINLKCFRNVVLHYSACTLKISYVPCL